MADTIRIRSTLPVAIRVVEPHPDPNRPGDSPVLKQAIVRPGVNTLSGDEVVAYRAWADTKPDFLAAGTVAEMAEGEGEPEVEYGFEVALDRAVNAGSGDAGQGSTVKDPGPVPAEEMRTGSPDAAPAAPVLASTAPLKVPATSDAPAAAPAAKAQLATPAK